MRKAMLVIATLSLGFLLFCSRVTGSVFGIATPGSRDGGVFCQYASDGMVLFGGLNTAQDTLNDVHLYNLTTNQWKMIRTFGNGPSPRRNAFGQAYQGRFYICGGLAFYGNGVFGPPLGDCFVLDLTTFVWSSMPNLGITRATAASVLVQDSMLVFGGSSSIITSGMVNNPTGNSIPTPCSSETYLFNFTRQVWINVTTTVRPPGACAASMIAVGIGVRMTGGSTHLWYLQGTLLPNSVLAQIWQWDATTQQWSNVTNPVGPWPPSRTLALWMMDPHTSLAYYLGGTIATSSGFVYFAQIDVYNVTANTWQVGAYSGPIFWSTFSGYGWSNLRKYFILTGFYDSSINTASSMVALLDPASFQSQGLVNVAQVTDLVTTAGTHRVFYGSAVDSWTRQWWMFGGALDANDGTCSQTTTVCDLVTNVCTLAATSGSTIPQTRFSPVMASFAPHKLLLFGGVSNNWVAQLNDLYVLDTSNPTAPVWTLIMDNSNNVSVPAGRADHTIVGPWQQRYYVVYGGQGEVQNYADTWLLDVSSASSGTFVWRVFPTLNTPISRYGHSAVLQAGVMWVQGGNNNSPSFAELWQLDLATGIWTLTVPAAGTAVPAPRSYHGCALMGDNMYLFGGLDNQGNILADVWSYSIRRNTYVQIVALDTTVTFSGALGLRCVVAPFYASQTIYCGTGQPIGNNPYVMQVFNPGYHDIVVSSSSGDNALCQLDETKPCRDIVFALTAFFTATWLESIVSKDMLNRLTLAGGTTNSIANVALSVPIELRSSGSNVVLDCSFASCFLLTDIVSSPFTLTGPGLVIRNARGVATAGAAAGGGGALVLFRSWLVATQVTFLNHTTTGSGAAIYATASSTLELSTVDFVGNTATISGGAIYLDHSQLQLGAGSRFQSNQAGQSGGAVAAIASDLDLDSVQFSFNLVRTSASSAAAAAAATATGTLLVAGGAMALTDCVANIRHSLLFGNRIEASASSGTFGGAIFAYATALTVNNSQLSNNQAQNGGAIATSSVASDVAPVLASILVPSSNWIANTRFSDNIAWATGGALATSNAQQTVLTNCTWTNNVAQLGGGALACNVSDLQVAWNEFDNNTCLYGNGGAAALLGLASTFASCSFTDNASPNGGGGAIYWADDTGSTPPTRSTRPVLTRTKMRSKSSSAFGDLFATQPVDIVMDPAVQMSAMLNQTAGGLFAPVPRILLVDRYNQTITNQALLVTAQTDHTANDLSGNTLVLVTNGVASFDELTIHAAPNETFALWFSVAFQGNVFLTPKYQMTTAMCLPPNQRYDQVQRVCAPCDARTLTTLPMQPSCQFQLQTNDSLQWQTSWFLVFPLAIGTVLCLFVVVKTQMYADRMIDDPETTPWVSIVILVLGTGTCTWAEINLMLQVINIGATYHGTFENVFMQVSGTFLIISWILSLVLSAVAWFLIHLTWMPNPRHPQRIPLGTEPSQLTESMRQKRKRNRYQAEHSRSSSSLSSVVTSTTSSSTDSVELVDLHLHRPDQQSANIRDNLPALNALGYSIYAAAGIVQYLLTCLNLDLHFVGAMHVSQWQMELNVPLLFGVGAVLLAPAYTIQLHVIYRAGWGSRYERWIRWPMALLSAGQNAALYWIVFVHSPLTYVSWTTAVDAASGNTAWPWSNLAATLFVVGVSTAFAGFYFVFESRGLGQSLFEYIAALDSWKDFAPKAWHVEFNNARLRERDIYRLAGLYHKYRRPFGDDLLHLLFANPFPNDKNDPLKEERMMRNHQRRRVSPYQARKMAFLLPSPNVHIKETSTYLTVPGAVEAKATTAASRQSHVKYMLSRMFESPKALSLYSEWAREGQVAQGDTVAILLDFWILKTCWSTIRKRPMIQQQQTLDAKYWCTEVFAFWKDYMNIAGRTKTAIQERLDKQDFSLAIFDTAIHELLKMLSENSGDFFGKCPDAKEFEQVVTECIQASPHRMTEDAIHMQQEDTWGEDDDDDDGDDEAPPQDVPLVAVPLV